MKKTLEQLKQRFENLFDSDAVSDIGLSSPIDVTVPESFDGMLDKLEQFTNELEKKRDVDMASAKLLKLIETGFERFADELDRETREELHEIRELLKQDKFDEVIEEIRELIAEIG